MRTTRQERVEATIPVDVTCDCCKNVIDALDIIEYQEVETFKFVAGYGSQYNDDGDLYEVDLCQHCIRKLLGPYLRRVKNMFGDEPFEVIETL